MSGNPVRVPAGYRVGDCRVTGLLGSGSWGSVYAAERDGGPVALKFLPPLDGGAGRRAVLREVVAREKRYARADTSPYLVRTHDVVDLADPVNPELDGCTVLVMELARTSLKEVLEAAAPGRPVPGATGLLAAVCAALAGMHRRHLVHGDLKPANVLVMPGGEVRLADFGLTTEVEGTHGYAPQLGSPDHLPPEWWSERATVRGVRVRPATDIWALGVLVHLLLTGGFHPFPGATARARAMSVQAYARGRAPLLLHETLPEGWRTVVSDCLRPDPARRAELSAADLLTRVVGLAPNAAAFRAGRRRGARSHAALVALSAVVLGMLCLGGDRHAPAHSAEVTGPPPYSSARGELRAGVDVPVRYRKVITDSAHACPLPDVTPALIGAMLKAESGFDPNLRDDVKREYGMARWTPEVFAYWAVDGDGDGRASLWSPYDAVMSVGRYLCWMDQRFTGFRANPAYGLGSYPMTELLEAGYRTSTDAVVRDHGPPAATRGYVGRVQRYLARYAVR